jgi:hypothetical protein
LSANQRSLIVRGFFDDNPVKDGFHHMPPLKAFLQCVLHSVAFDQIIPGLDPLMNEAYIHIVYPVYRYNQPVLRSTPAVLTTWWLTI